MRCVQLVPHNSDEGSAVSGFAVIAPLVTLVFVAVIAIASVLGQRVVLGAAASSGARMAATLGATHGQARQQINQVLLSYSVNPTSVTTQMWRARSSGVPAVFVRLTKTISVPWINQRLTISTTSHRIDENS